MRPPSYFFLISLLSPRVTGNYNDNNAEAFKNVYFAPVIEGLLYVEDFSTN